MSKEVSNEAEKLGNATLLNILFGSLWSLLLLTTLMFRDQWSENLIVTLEILGFIMMFLALWFAFKMAKLSKIVKNDSKLLKQLRDERNLEIDYKSRATGLLGCLGFAIIYIIIATVQKLLFSNSFLFEMKSFSFAVALVAVGSITTVVSAFYLNKK